MKNKKLLNMVLCALFAALIAVGAFIRIPFGLVPATLQTFFVALAGLMLGKKYGALSAAVYALIGLAGVPVFTGGGGLGYVLTPGFGYILGFILGAFAAGYIAEKGKPTFVRFLLASLACLGAVYSVGALYYLAISVWYLGKEVVASEWITGCVLVFLPGDAVFAAAGAFIAVRVRKILKKEEK